MINSVGVVYRGGLTQYWNGSGKGIKKILYKGVFMNVKQQLLALSLFLCGASAMYAAGSPLVSVKVSAAVVANVQRCGDFSDCAQYGSAHSTFAIGDVHPLDFEHAKITPLKATGQKVDFELPLKAGGTVVYSQVLQEGELAGKTILVALRNSPEPRFGPGHTNIVILRHIKGVDQKNKAIEAGNIELTTAGAIEAGSVSFLVEPDGTYTLVDTYGTPTIDFFLGNRVVKSEVVSQTGERPAKRLRTY